MAPIKPRVEDLKKSQKSAGLSQKALITDVLHLNKYIIVGNEFSSFIYFIFLNVFICIYCIFQK